MAQSKFSSGIQKAKSFFNDPKKLGYAGLGALAIPTAYHGVEAIKDMGSKDKKERKGSGMRAGMAGVELGGLGLLAREVQKAH